MRPRYAPITQRKKNAGLRAFIKLNLKPIKRSNEENNYYDYDWVQHVCGLNNDRAINVHIFM